MSKLAYNKFGYILEGTVGSLAVIALLYVVTTAVGFRKVLVKTVNAAENSTNTPYFDHYHDKTTIEMPNSSVILPILDISSSNIYIKGQIGGKYYPVRVDTGLGFGQLCLSSNIKDGLGLKFWPAGEIWPGTTGGICHLDCLKLGDISILNPETVYINQYWQKQLFTVALDNDEQISVGLGIVREFSYIMIDRANSCLIFSKDADFRPADDKWQKFDMSIELDQYNQPRLFVKVTVAKVAMKLIFDTCGGRELKLSSNNWAGVITEVGDYHSSKSEVLLGQFGRQQRTKITAESLTIGSIGLSDAEILISDDKLCNDILPMGFLKNHTVVLDFAKGQFWIHQ